ncbi:MAG: DPP IV N-terminal domain-containing protein, partial [Bacteroidota bacterium]
SHHVQVGIYSLDQLKTVFLKTGEPLDQYLTNIAWSPNEEHLYVVHLNRDQNHLQLKQYDARTGDLQKTILEETGEAYVEPEHPMIFLKDRPDEFLWFSERDGFQHLYHYKLDGTLIRQLTSGNWEVTDFLGTDENGTHILLAGTGENATERHIYRVDLSNGKRQQLTKEAGMHRGVLHPDGHHLIQHFSSIDVPHRVTATTSAGKQVGTLLEAANPLEEYAIGTTELLTIKAKDGTELHARMIKPHDFDPKRKYPVLVYVYGGPHAQLVLNTWLGGAPMWMHHMANRGYLIFTVDNRGSAHRGLAFEQATFRNLGQLEMQDQLDGVAYLKGLDYVDPDRLAVHGWSYGGF